VCRHHVMVQWGATITKALAMEPGVPLPIFGHSNLTFFTPRCRDCTADLALFDDLEWTAMDDDKRRAEAIEKFKTES
jgi:hypothetical protein